MRPIVQPLPPRNGLTASRVRAPYSIEARSFLRLVIEGQRHRHPLDNSAALDRRFAAGEVRDRRGQVIAPGQVLAAG